MHNTAFFIYAVLSTVAVAGNTVTNHDRPIKPEGVRHEKAEEKVHKIMRSSGKAAHGKGMAAGKEHEEKKHERQVDANGQVTESSKGKVATDSAKPTKKSEVVVLADGEAQVSPMVRQQSPEAGKSPATLTDSGENERFPIDDDIEKDAVLDELEASTIQYALAGKRPVDCKWSEWEWTECSKTCGGGTKEETRYKERKEKNGGTCDGPDKKGNKRCNTEECPTTTEKTSTTTSAPTTTSTVATTTMMPFQGGASRVGAASFMPLLSALWLFLV